jgi:hypothetical protein
MRLVTLIEYVFPWVTATVPAFPDANDSVAQLA